MKCPECGAVSWVYNSSGAGVVYCNNCGNGRAEMTAKAFVDLANSQPPVAGIADAERLKADIRAIELPYGESWCERVDEIVNALPVSGEGEK